MFNKLYILDAFKETIKAFGHVDILINNAGIVKESNWEGILDVNMVGTTNKHWYNCFRNQIN